MAYLTGIYLAILFHTISSQRRHTDPYVIVKEEAATDHPTTVFPVVSEEDLREDFPEMDKQPLFAYDNLTKDAIKHMKKHYGAEASLWAGRVGGFVKTMDKALTAGKTGDYSKLEGSFEKLMGVVYKKVPTRGKAALQKVYSKAGKFMSGMSSACTLVGAVGDLLEQIESDKTKIKTLNFTVGELEEELKDMEREVDHMVKLIITNLQRMENMQALAAELKETLDGVQEQLGRIAIGTEHIAKDTVRIANVMHEQEKKIKYGLCWKENRPMTTSGLARWYYYDYHQHNGSTFNYFQTFKESGNTAWWCIDWEQPACTIHVHNMGYKERYVGARAASLMERIHRHHFKFLYACHHTKVNFRKTCVYFTRPPNQPASLMCFLVKNIDVIESELSVKIPLAESDIKEYITQTPGRHYPFEAFGCEMRPNHYYPSCNISSFFEPY